MRPGYLLAPPCRCAVTEHQKDHYQSVSEHRAADVIARLRVVPTQKYLTKGCFVVRH